MAKDNTPKIEKSKAELIAELVIFKNSTEGKNAIRKIMANKNQMIKEAREESEKNK